MLKPLCLFCRMLNAICGSAALYASMLNVVNFSCNPRRLELLKTKQQGIVVKSLQDKES